MDRLRYESEAGYALRGSTMGPEDHTPTDAPKSSKPGTPETTASPKLTPPGAVREYIEDVKLMLKYCRNRGLPIPEKLQEVIPSIYAIEARDQWTSADHKALLDLHGKLGQLVAPATPSSLGASRFSFTDKRAWKTSLFLVIVALAALIGVIGYIWTLPTGGSADPNAEKPVDDTAAAEYSAGIVTPASIGVHLIGRGTQPTKSGTPGRTRGEYLNFFFAAVIGASFYALLTALGYLRKYTFEDRYVWTYLTRFCVGVLGGVMLASCLAGLFEDSETLMKLGPSALALIGGYSAEAVKNVLDRLVEILLTTVQGRNGFDKQRTAIAQEVVSIVEVASGDHVQIGDVKEKLSALLKKLQQ